MKHYRIRLCLWKAYFEKGLSLTNYVKYIVALFGMAEVIDGNFNTALVIMIIYAVNCFVLGWAWFRLGLMDAEHEVYNRFNPFVKEMRKKIK